MTRCRPPFPWLLLRFWFMRILPVWSLIALLMFLMQLAVCGIVHDNQGVKTLLGLIEVLPSIVKTALGGDGLQAGNLPGLIAIGHNHPFVLSLFLIFAVGVPTVLLPAEVQRGTMELILSRWATKTQIYICAALMTTAGMASLAMVVFLGTVTGTNIYDFGEPIPLYSFFQLAVNGGLCAAAFGAVALLSAASFRRTGTAVSVAVAFIVANYFAAILSMWWPRIRWLRSLTLFNYTNGRKIFGMHEWPVSDMLVLGAIILVVALAGGLIWRRRDLPL